MLYPLKFQPLLKERIWGGDNLKKKLKQRVADDVKIGESWEISGLDGDISVVTNGILAENNLNELIEVYMGELVGEKVYAKFGLEFPLLIKFIDTQQVLSIQVHPNDELSKDRHNSAGKTELWYVLDAQEGGVIYAGFNSDITKAQYIEAVDNGTLPTLLKKIEVKKGDAFFIPAGTIHTIGKGLSIVEIQQTSDITYRIDDWGRVDSNGEARQLDTELAVDAINFDSNKTINVSVEQKTDGTVGILECEYFTTNIVNIETELERDYVNLDSFVIYICIEGQIDINVRENNTTLQIGESLLVPAQENSVKLKGKATILEIYIK